MSSIPEATPITLTQEERAELEGLARSTKTEHRMRQRARIVLLDLRSKVNMSHCASMTRISAAKSLS
jgi:hypothetical protein